MKRNFGLDLSIYSILCLLMAFGLIPAVQRGLNDPPTKNSYLLTQSPILNEYYLQHPEYVGDPPLGTQGAIDFPWLYKYIARTDQWTFNHSMLPLYRAVKTGQPLSNMGYNDHPIWPGSFTNMEDIKPVENLNYKNRYTSGSNNGAEWFYAFIPKELRHIDSPEKELELAQFFTKYQFGRALFQILGYFLFFIAVWLRVSRITAWFCAAALLLNPQPFFLSLNPNFDFVFFMYFPAYIVYFYIPISKHFTWKAFLSFAIGFCILTGLTMPHNMLFPLIFTWSPSIALIFFIDTCRALENGSYFWQDMKKSVFRIGAVALASLLFIVPWYLLEKNQAALWIGGSTNSNISRLFSISNFGDFKNYGEIFYRTVRKFLALIESIQITPYMWVSLYLPEGLQTKLQEWNTVRFFLETILFMPLWFLSILMFVYWSRIIGKMQKKYFFPIFIKLAVAAMFFLFWFFAFHLLFPRPGIQHYHMHGGTLSAIITLLIFASTGYLTQKYLETRG